MITLPTNVFGAAELTASVSVVPRSFTLLGDLGLFDRIYLRTKNVEIDEQAGNLNLIPSALRGGPAAQNKRGSRAARFLETPWFPLADQILASDFDGIRAFASEDLTDVQEEVANRLIELSRKHQNMQEYLRWTALGGTVKDADGSTLLNIFSEYGVSQESFDFDFAGTTETRKVIRDISRFYQANSGGTTVTGIMVLCSNGFFDALLGKAEVATAYQFATTGINPLRDNLNGVFDYAGARFVNVSHSFSYENAAGVVTTYSAVPANEAIIVPMAPAGSSVFKQYFSPGTMMGAIGKRAEEIYVSAEPIAHDQGVSLLSGSATLPLCTRPKLLAKGTIT